MTKAIEKDRMIKKKTTISHLKDSKIIKNLVLSSTDIISRKISYLSEAMFTFHMYNCVTV